MGTTPQQPPPPKTKQVNKHVSTVVDVANITWKLLRATGQIEFSVASRDPMTGKPKHSITHTVSLTQDEQNHLDKGGKIVLVHLCGWQPHIRI
ncbi:hypothetical protein [Zavarzinella formosa]|uniref:hypothetical protein n=1 Tax=Zavarzinella formosa TaxID=360055 RepID=UPI00049845C7|nr:hypothetical protein [Zavarzinella formosa]